MAAPIPQPDELVAVLTRFPGGATAEQIESELQPRPDPKVLRYSLRLLIEQNRVTCDGPVAKGRFRLVGADIGSTRAPAQVIAKPAQNPSPSDPIVAAPPPKSVPVPPPSDGRSLFDELFERCVARIVLGVMPKVSAQNFLQVQAMLGLPTPPERQAFVAHGLARLDALAADEAAKYGIGAPQFGLWQRQYRGKG